jgi:5-methylcytosine-specific restriction endonuclease McrA
MPQKIKTLTPPWVTQVRASRQRDDSNRPTAAERGYCDKKHRAWRQAVLTAAAWQCRACGRVCADKLEAQADHIVPISEGGSRYDVGNGQCLCIRCHGRKTRGEQQRQGKGHPRD